MADDETSHVVQSFAVFYAAEYRPVLAFAASFCRDLDAAEDLTQDAFIAAQQRWGELRNFDRPDLWVRRVVANRSVSRWRRLLSDERRVRKLAELRRSEFDADASGGEIDIWRLVSQLPARQAQVIALTYLEDRSLADIAAVLGIAVETAKTHLQRGRAALARAIQHEGSEDTQ
ncbi:MAG: sigma-70 family RNA polymerase sigma factor [Actinomycetota bacterium]|nr:sigma-70 family RNA polymerase sigma factor [Actinomycetota bacterium]